MSLTISPATSDDREIVFGFISALAAYVDKSDELSATADSIAKDLFGDNPKIHCDIARWHGEPAGFALWFNTYSTFLGAPGIWLEDLFVAEEFRGHGIGKALLANLAKRCEAENWARLEWSVLDYNTNAISFYTSLGAQLMDEWKICRVEGAGLGGFAQN